METNYITIPATIILWFVAGAIVGKCFVWILDVTGLADRLFDFIDERIEKQK